MQIGDTVNLVPTQGVYQKPLQGVVTSLTPSLVGVTREGDGHEVRYRLTDGRPFKKSDQAFPCYVIQPTEPPKSESAPTMGNEARTERPPRG